MTASGVPSSPEELAPVEEAGRLHDYPPIGEYAFLSDCHTGALVGPDGAVEWLCAPRFDGPSVFGRILDHSQGGAWELYVPGANLTERAYVPESLVLRSRWDGDGGSVTVHDFLAVARPPESSELEPIGRLVRWARCTRGRARVRSRVLARPDYGDREAAWSVQDEGWAEQGGVLLAADLPPELLDAGTPEVDTVLSEGESMVVVLDYTGRRLGPVDADEAARLLDDSVRAWRSWSDRSDYDGVGAAQVRHSAAVLRGLLFDESGGLLAAPTTSLPEWLGGPRNWDYRYVWHRDAALVVLALLRLGHDAEAGRYLRFLLEHCAADGDWIAPVFAIDGGETADETERDHLDGYAGSRPVRSGNRAAAQHQLDVYGHVLDAALAYQEVTGELTDAEVEQLWEVVAGAQRHWRDPDAGIWEVQGPERHWTHSKVYAWACFDRAIRLAELVGDTAAPVDEWRRERDLVHEDILANGYDAELGSFVQSYGSTNVDGSLLRIPLLGFLPADDPRVLGTIERVDAELGEAGDLVHRYDPVATGDGMDSPEGAFLLCSFEMVAALVLAGRVDEAQRRFDALCERAGPLGLYSEEMTADGTMLGNYPQAFTHLALIQAALNLDGAGRRDALHDWAERRVSRR